MQTVPPSTKAQWKLPSGHRGFIAPKSGQRRSPDRTDRTDGTDSPFCLHQRCSPERSLHNQSTKSVAADTSSLALSSWDQLLLALRACLQGSALLLRGVSCIVHIVPFQSNIADRKVRMLLVEPTNSFGRNVALALSTVTDVSSRAFFCAVSKRKHSIFSKNLAVICLPKLKQTSVIADAHTFTLQPLVQLLRVSQDPLGRSTFHLSKNNDSYTGQQLHFLPEVTLSLAPQLMFFSFQVSMMEASESHYFSLKI